MTAGATAADAGAVASDASDADDVAGAGAARAEAPVTVYGWSRLEPRVLLADASQAMAMVGAGADRLIDLRAETKPPGLAVTIEHCPIEDLVPGQDDLILAAARRVRELTGAGHTVGVYCQAGVSRTSTVAIAYLVLGGVPLPEALDQVRRVRPQAMPALELWHSLERLAAQEQAPRPPAG